MQKTDQEELYGERVIPLSTPNHEKLIWPRVPGSQDPRIPRDPLGYGKQGNILSKVFLFTALGGQRRSPEEELVDNISLTVSS